METSGHFTARPSPALVYDQLFVPALFQRWAPTMAEAVNLCAGQRVLDVACGTGALTCPLVDWVGAHGSVVGLDASPEMLEVARSKRCDIAWHEGLAEALPFPAASFDAVVSQFGLMFFDDPAAALREMQRVLCLGGRLAVAVWDAVERSPGYALLAALLDELFGQRIGDAFRAPFALGHREQLHELATRAGLQNASITAHSGTVQFESVDALLRTERACVWTLGGLLDDEQFERLLARARPAFRAFGAEDGRVEFECPALVIRAVKT